MKKTFYKNNAPVVYLLVLRRLARKCTKIYNACRTIVRLIKPFVLRLFRSRCGLYKVPAVVVYKKSRCRHISVLFASIFAILTSKSLKIPSEQNCAACRFPHWKSLYHSPMEISGNSYRNFWSNGKRPLFSLNKFIRSKGLVRICFSSGLWSFQNK